MKYKYLKETGAIITPNNHALTILDGTPGQVDFPEEMIWGLHKGNPGIVYKLAHVHPPVLTELSARDRQTMKTWAFALYPYPVRMSTLTLANTMSEFVFIETTYLGILEPKEFWKKGSKRSFEIIQEEQAYYEDGYDDLNSWQKLLIDRSFSF